MKIHHILTMLSGAEPDSLKHAAFVERFSYPILGALMILAAIWTSIGMSIKIVYGFDLSWIAGVGIGTFMFSFILLLEAIMLATLSNTIRGWVLRLSLGFLLMLMQTVH